MKNPHTNLTTVDLALRWAALRATTPHMRIRNAADQLGVSEVELLATRCGEGVTRLRPDFRDILRKVESLGRVMALTRNDEVVLERKGVYLNPTLTPGPMGLFVGEDIDLRIFFNAWGSAFAVKDEIAQKPGTYRYSLQFFAKDGEAVHKIYLTHQSDEAAYHDLVKEFTNFDQGDSQQVEPSHPAQEELPDSTIDVEEFRQSWIGLKDTHHFFGLLKKHRLTRTQALRLAPEGDFAVRLGNAALRRLLTLASEQKVPIMIFVGNPGMIQIHSGPVTHLKDFKEWVNVLDPDINLHVKEPAIAESWVVRKPTEDGIVTSLECFNADGKQIVQFFGQRKPGIPELQSWRDIVREIESHLHLVQ